MGQRYKPSYYNLVVPHGHWTLLFNGVSSGLMRLPADIAQALLPLLGPPRPRIAGQGLREWQCPDFERADLPPALNPLFDDLLRGQFFLPGDFDEIANLKQRYAYFRRTSPFFVTITTTLDCNLGCYYCYQDRSRAYLTRASCDRILDWVKEQIRLKEHKKLYTDWYGGEPMLNQDAIEYFSEQAVSYCTAHDIGYSSSMISNGTLWPEDARGFVERTRIRHVQFTFDGPREAHNKRRRYARQGAEDKSSFDAIAATIDRLLGAIRIYVRINVDPWVGRDVLSLIEFFRDRGWLGAGTRFYPYLASIGPMTEHCSFLGASPKVREFQEAFNELNHDFQLALAQYMDPRGIQHLQYYPMTVNINCAAVAENSVIFGPDGLMYKCGLEVGDVHKAHDQLDLDQGQSAFKIDLPLINVQVGQQPASPQRWNDYDPFQHPRCSQCQYLPICMGGCPKVHMDHNEYYLGLQSKYWEDNFDRVIRTYYETAIRSAELD